MENSRGRSRKVEERPRIIIERQFTGKAELSDMIIPYMVENTRRNIAEMMKDGKIGDRHRIA